MIKSISRPLNLNLCTFSDFYLIINYPIFRDEPVRLLEAGNNPRIDSMPVQSAEQ